MLITAFAGVARMHAATLEKLFGDQIELESRSYDQGSIKEALDADLFVISTYPIYHNVKFLLPRGAKTIIMNNTITNEQYERIRAIPRGTTVLLVNYSVEMTMDTISLLRQLGLEHIHYEPWYPGVAQAPDLEIAVTPGESHHVPPNIRTIIDIGHRVIDEKSLVDIAHFLELDRLLQEERFVSHFKSLRKVEGSVASLFDLTNVLESQLSGLLEVMEDGLIVADSGGVVYAGNAKALDILGERGSLVGKRIKDLIPGLPLDRVLETRAPAENRLMRIRSLDVSVKLVPVMTSGKANGALAILNTFDERERSQSLLRSQLLGKGHRAKYSFDSIITRDAELLEIKNHARKKARSSASVLIIGETGTGKELFAHAIHNGSERRNAQFVTVNCAALPESLLESELFGYVDGAFTGARKGGKAGLFELAHKGTIFLDEIGEMDLGLQARLLRVLESREVMRIGGDSVIHIDIRVIAATNKDLWSLVQEGRFRGDLYYRLNVLPIHIPPLRERKGDIILIFESIKDSLGARFSLSEEAQGALLDYAWLGNIRELKNCVEYLACLEKERIEARDLAPLLVPPGAIAEKRETGTVQGRGKELAEPRTSYQAENPIPQARNPSGSGQNPEEEHLLFVLSCLYDNYRLRVRTGRRSLQRRAEDADLFLSEAQIRRILGHLESMRYVTLSNGRGGTTITQAGIEAYRRLERAGREGA